MTVLSPDSAKPFRFRSATPNDLVAAGIAPTATKFAKPNFGHCPNEGSPAAPPPFFSVLRYGSEAREIALPALCKTSATDHCSPFELSKRDNDNCSNPIG